MTNVPADPVQAPSSVVPQWKHWDDLDGFRPGVYTLNLEKVWDLPIRRLRGQGAAEQTTVGEVVKALQGQEIKEVSGWNSVHVKTESEGFVFEGPAIARQWLWVFATLAQAGIHPGSTRWYPFDADHDLEEPAYAYSFFVVAQGRIVLDSVVLHKDDVLEFACREPPFDPDTFVPYDGSSPTWASERHATEAVVRYWYRKFYRETLPGQLMVLRPDRPELFYYTDERNEVRGGDTDGGGASPRPPAEDTDSVQKRLTDGPAVQTQATGKRDQDQHAEGRGDSLSTRRLPPPRRPELRTDASAAALLALNTSLQRIQLLLVGVLILLIGQLLAR